MEMRQDQRPSRLMQLRADFVTLVQQLYWESFKPTEVGLAVLADIWAIGLLTNPHLFSLSQSYAAMAGIMPERGWAVVCAAVGLIPLVALAFRSYILRLVSLVLHVTLWTFVAVMFILATPKGLGGPIYLFLFGGGASWAAIRVAGEYRPEILASLSRMASAASATIAHWRTWRWRERR